MAYDKKARQEASKRGWETRRKSLPDYKVPNSAGSISPTDDKDLATELPVERIFEAGGIAGWEDAIYDIDVDGYQVVHNCLPVIETVDKMGIRISKLDWTLLGDGPRAKAIAEIIDQISNWTDMVKWLNWASIDGVRYMQIKSALGLGPWVVPDFFMGGRKKFKAGGDMQWDGTTLMQVERTTGVATTQAKKLPLEQFIIHRPGGGSNPEGDSNIGLATYRVAVSWEGALKNTDAYMELFSLPIRVFKNKISNVRPDRIQSALSSVATKLQNLKNNQTAILTDEQMLELIEPKGKGFEDMVEYAKYLEGLLDQLFLSNQLTSTVNDAQRTGNTSVHLDEESEAVYAGAMQMAETFNRYLIPWIVRKNPDLPPLGEDEWEVYIWPQAPIEEDQGDEQEIEVDDNQIEDTGDGQRTSEVPGAEAGGAEGGDRTPDTDTPDV